MASKHFEIDAGDAVAGVELLPAGRRVEITGLLFTVGAATIVRFTDAAEEDEVTVFGPHPCKDESDGLVAGYNPDGWGYSENGLKIFGSEAASIAGVVSYRKLHND